MDVPEYAKTTANNAGDEGRRELDRLATTVVIEGKVDYRHPTIEHFRAGFLTCRGLLTAAIDRLNERPRMPEEEIRDLEFAMKQAIHDAHLKVLGSDHLAEDVQIAMQESEKLCEGKLDNLISSGRDKLRIVQDERRFTKRVTWLSAIAGAGTGAVAGAITSGALPRFVGRVVRILLGD